MNNIGFALIIYNYSQIDIMIIIPSCNNTISGDTCQYTEFELNKAGVHLLGIKPLKAL